MVIDRSDVSRSAAGVRDQGTGQGEAPPASHELVYRRMCRTSDVTEGKPGAFTVKGMHLAVFRREWDFFAVDNRCPRMGYPLSAVYRGTEGDEGDPPVNSNS